MLENDGATGMSMEDRLSNLENLAQLSIRLHRMMQESLNREQEERRQMGEVMDQLIRAVALIKRT